MTTANKVKAPQNSINEIPSGYAASRRGREAGDGRTFISISSDGFMTQSEMGRGRGTGGESDCGTYFKFKADIENILIKILLPLAVAKATANGGSRGGRGQTDNSCRA